MLKWGKGKYRSPMWGLQQTVSANSGWLDERPFREYVEDVDLLFDDRGFVGWHIFSTPQQAIDFKIRFGAYGKCPTVRVECYGLDDPYGLGLAFGKPAGRFQFMKILEEVT
jgi:hypothetical protein